MKKFFILSQNLPLKWKTILIELQISVEIFSYWYGSGILVKEIDIIKFLNAMGLEVEYQIMTSTQDVYRLTTKSVRSVIPKVHVARWRGCQKAASFKSVTEEILLPYLKKNIIIDVPHNWPTKLADDGCLHILLWSSPVGWSNIIPPQKIWGVSVPCRDKSMLFSNNGFLITDNISGYKIGELLRNCLYIYHDICHVGTKSEVVLYQKILEKSLNYFKLIQNPTS